MRILFLVIALSAYPAHAELYRWIDRETGSVKFSNTPPPWYGDPDRERGAPAVEVIQYRGSGAPAKPAAAPDGAALAASAVAALEARWAELVKFFGSLPAASDFSRAGIRQQLESYQALSAELDRLDPAGAARRRAQEAGALETIRRGLEAQFRPKPPAE